MLVFAGVIRAATYEMHVDHAQVRGMAVDPAGNVYLSGYTWSEAVMSLNRQPQVLKKLDATGATAYTVNLGDLTYTSTFLLPTGIQVTGVAVDQSGSAYVTGFVNQAGLQTMNAAQPFQRDRVTPSLRGCDRMAWVWSTSLISGVVAAI